MRSAYWGLTAAVSAAVVSAVSLEDVCTTEYVKASLPADGFYLGITVNPSSVVAAPVTNATVTDEVWYPNASFDYCNATFTYTHDGRDDEVIVTYWLPSPDNFKNRYLSTGGGGYAINSGSSSLPGGIIYGAVAGITDGGFGGFDTKFDADFIIENGTAKWESLYMFGYQAIHELSIVGKAFTKNFFNMSDTKLYSYYQGCSEGGRDGWSQVQRFADEWDGAVTGAPAFRFSFQQVQHLYSNVVEQTLGYYPPPCELEKILNETLAACDPMDGKTDGVVARSDLCKLNFNVSSTIGKSYYCAASGSSSSKRQMSSSSYTPAQSGVVTAEGAAVAKEIVDGLRDTDGRRVYFSYQPSASFADAETAYNSETGSWELSIASTGGEFIERYLRLLDSSTLPSLENVTYDTLKEWMIEGWARYEDTLHTTWPDLSPFQQAGGKVLHFHGESDNSIPAASSVRYHESVRSIMYPDLSFNESIAELNKWYRFYLVPGAAHCQPNTNEPNGPWPQTSLEVLINWVENSVEPTTLNATILQGSHKGENQQICPWPLRPYWSNSNSSNPDCVYDQASIDNWIYDFDAIKMPVY